MHHGTNIGLAGLILQIMSKFVPLLFEISRYNFRFVNTAENNAV
ncbi:hypothetical protein JCM19294_1835 [Nonlabens tegetincola]|uniref:Uncharacterized protein n=1 Tax=Nonlabens tegetincola TaxID=323273 RepID=A0A090Q2A9_9FLAO|nr:hypothetical protein JCM19294_1835 [Nonlabens tegetincola]